MKWNTPFTGALVALLFAGAVTLAPSAWGDARVQIVHAAPFADTVEGTSVTVAANGSPLLEDFLYTDFTDFLDIPAGDYELTVTPTGGTDPAITADVTLEDNVEYTVLATGDGVNQPLALWPLVNDFDAPATGNLNLRVLHAAPFASDSDDTEVSIRTAGGDVINGLVGVPYFGDSGFFEVPAGEIDFKVASNDGSTNLIDPESVVLPPELNVTVVAIGDGVNQPLGILALPVGEVETRDPVDLSVTGWWGTTNSSNEGLILQPIPAENRLVGTVYTYDPAGSGEPRWYTFDTCNPAVGASGCPDPGGFDGISATATVYEFTGGQFGDGTGVTGEAAGVLAIEFIDCDSGVASVELDSGETLMWDLRKLVETTDCSLDLRQAQFPLLANVNDGPIATGVSGLATFREWPGDRTLVMLELDGGPTGTDVSHAAHIHFNSLSEGGDIAFFLGPIDGLGTAPGKSWFLVDQSFDTLMEFDGHINIHESNAALGNIVARGNIGANAEVNTTASTLAPLRNGRTQIYDLPANPNAGAVPDGVDATAEFIEIGSSRTLVKLTLTDGSTGTTVSHPAHIHANSAAEGGGIVFFLGPIDGLGPATGVSYAIVNEGFDTLVNFDGHINIHESNAALGNIVARGDIGANAGGN